MLTKRLTDGEGSSGSAGHPNAGATSDESKQMKHWREAADLADGSDKQ